MLKILKKIVAILMPWVVLLANDNPGGALVALVMQVTLVGWPFASAWALKVVRQNEEERAKEKKEAMEKKAAMEKQKTVNADESKHEETK